MLRASCGGGVADTRQCGGWTQYDERVTGFEFQLTGSMEGQTMKFEITGSKDGPQNLYLTYEKDGYEKSILLPTDAADRVSLSKEEHGLAGVASALRTILGETLPRESEDRDKAKEVLKMQSEAFDSLNSDVSDWTRD
jgi:hypothetical protein